MTTGALSNALKGISGEFEIQRILGALGSVTYIVTVPLFVSIGKFGGVTLGEFCLMYPAGLAACIGATAGAIALKDRNVAKAKATEAETSATNANTADQVAATEKAAGGG